MDLNALLLEKGIDPKQVLVMRHQPQETELNRLLPLLASERPNLFNAFQRSHRPQTEKAMLRAKYLASFIARDEGRAIFVGLYRVGRSRPVSYDEFWRKPANRELKKRGMGGFSGERPSCLWFDLTLTEFYGDWKGKLIVDWPIGRAWWRWADRNTFEVSAILEESGLVWRVPDPENLTLTWEQLRILPQSHKSVLSAWRGVYYIFDTEQRKGYVGSAYGQFHLLGRWENYKKSVHGGNKQLRKCKAQNLRFSILQVVSTSTLPEEVRRIENAWKMRLHTREFGLNDN